VVAVEHINEERIPMMEKELRRFERDRAELAALLGVGPKVKKLYPLNPRRDEVLRAFRKVEALEPAQMGRRRSAACWTEKQRTYAEALILLTDIRAIGLREFRDTVRGAQRKVNEAIKAIGGKPL
jgi:hypothetical protein